MTPDIVTVVWAVYVIAFEATVLFLFVHLYRLPPSWTGGSARCPECRRELPEPESDG